MAPDLATAAGHDFARKHLHLQILGNRNPCLPGISDFFESFHPKNGKNFSLKPLKRPDKSGTGKGIGLTPGERMLILGLSRARSALPIGASRKVCPFYMGCPLSPEGVCCLEGGTCGDVSKTLPGIARANMISSI